MTMSLAVQYTYYPLCLLDCLYFWRPLSISRGRFSVCTVCLTPYPFRFTDVCICGVILRYSARFHEATVTRFIDSSDQLHLHIMVMEQTSCTLFSTQLSLRNPSELFRSVWRNVVLTGLPLCSSWWSLIDIPSLHIKLFPRRGRIHILSLKNVLKTKLTRSFLSGLHNEVWAQVIRFGKPIDV